MPSGSSYRLSGNSRSRRRLLVLRAAAELEEILATAEPLVGVEANFSGQLAQVLRQHTGIACDKLVVKYNGRPMSGRRLCDAFKTIMDGTDETKIVLRNPNE